MKYTINATKSINETLKSMKYGDTLFLENGVYKEKVVILINNITIEGESKDGVIITNHDWFTKIMPDFNECNTFRTYTLLAGGENITIKNLTIENSSVPSSRYGQALALYAEGDGFKAYNVALKSAQDTLFTGPLSLDLIERHQGFLPEYQLRGKKSRQIYENCDICGDVDFIFGAAQALFINCNIISIAREGKDGIDGFLCAPSTYQEDKYGYLFYKCNLIKENGVKNVYLGRPWRDYGSAAFIDCKMDDHINPEGFNPWGNSGRDKTSRFYEYNENADLSKRVKWAHILNKDEATKLVNEFFELVGYKK
ncbi:MAG: hypothetical protein K6A63_03505 [Acholeplasmatales bacterium]|nr:hypothetical protein [Acholeplasmatales bacterium]